MLKKKKNHWKWPKEKGIKIMREERESPVVKTEVSLSLPPLPEFWLL